MKKQKPSKHYLRWGLYAVLLVLLIVAMVSLRHDLHDAWQVTKSVNPSWIALGVGLMLVSVVCTSLVYHILSPKPLEFRKTFLVQTASLCINKVLPSGSGALGMSYLYLRSNKVDKVSAASLVALNNTIGFLGHATLLLLVLGLDHNQVRIPHLDLPAHLLVYVLCGLGAVLVLAAGLLVLSKKRPHGFDTKQLRQIGLTLRSPRRAFGALGTSIALTLCYVGCLAIALHSLGLSLGLPNLLIVLSVSVFATSVIPSPGGIGASEAGMFVALRAYDVAPGPALATAILYRVMTFWLPLAVGALAYVFVEKSKLITYKL